MLNLLYYRFYCMVLKFGPLPLVALLSIRIEGSKAQEGAKGDWISGSLIWSKTLLELTFNPCGEFRWSPESPVIQIHSPHLLVGAYGIFSDLLRFVQMLKRESGVRKATGRYRTYSSLVKLQPRFLSLQWKTCLSAELQPWCLSLQWRICPWGEQYWWYVNIFFGDLLAY